MERSCRDYYDSDIAYNNAIEQERQAYHARRCAENTIYKRVYERQKSIANQVVKQLSEVNQAMCVQKMDTERMHYVDQQHVKTRTDMLNNPYPSRLNTEQVLANGWSVLLLASLFVPEEQSKQWREELAYIEEIRKVDEEFSRRCVCKSGFEW